ncbi:MAG: ABC transporter permease [Acidimicrobiia bacterium]|nr:ABC transporter permease [Acidimicrobiia bacterium]
MFLRTIFAKTLRDRWLGMAIAASVLALFMLYAMAVYRDIDLSIYTDLPTGLRELMGIPEGADVASLSYNVMLGFTASLALAGLAISMGSAAVAGEERGGTLGLLLANPKSRTQVVLSKAGSLVALTGAAAAALAATGYLVPVVLSVEIGAMQVGAMMLHLFLNALFYGFLALAVGCWTGNRTLASGLSAGVMVVSYVATGLLPLVEGLAGAAKVFPWYYFDGSDPLLNGLDWSHLGILTGGCLVLGAVAVVGVNRRDLRGPSVGRTLLDRLRDDPRTKRVFERLAGSTRVSHLWVKTTSEYQNLLIVVATVMFALMGVLMGPMYTAIESSVADLGDQFPEAIMALAGGGDLSTPEGFYQVETFSLMAPMAVMIVTIVIGTRALAGEEARRTMGLLLANPIRRSTVVAHQSWAMVCYAVAVGVATFAGVLLGSVVAGLGMSVVGIAAASLLATLLGLLFGALALLLGAATGRVKIAAFGAAGAALASHLLNAFLPLSDRLASGARLTPNYYYLTRDPLVNGVAWSHAGVLAAVTVGLVAASAVAFERRDIRHG